MKVLNKIYKGIGFIFVQLLAVVQSYFLSVVVSAPFVCIAMFIISLANKGIMLFIADRFWWLYLIVCLPIAVALFVVLLKSTKTK